MIISSILFRISPAASFSRGVTGSAINEVFPPFSKFSFAKTVENLTRHRDPLVADAKATNFPILKKRSLKNEAIFFKF